MPLINKETEQQEQILETVLVTTVQLVVVMAVILTVVLLLRVVQVAQMVIPLEQLARKVAAVEGEVQSLDLHKVALVVTVN